MKKQLGVAVVGAGYWGPNLVRNFRASPDWDLVAVCDLDEQRARKVIGPRSTVVAESSFERLLERDDIDAVAIATPAQTHASLAMAALEAGKHVLVEKPLAPSVIDAAVMVEAARDADRVLMIDHTYCYTPAVQYIAQTVQSGTLGNIMYIDSTRINLGLVQPDVDVFWDLAPHDLSILDFILPGGLNPVEVSATGSDPLRVGNACVGHISLTMRDGSTAHINVNWLSPTKIRQMVIGGSHRTVVWDDLDAQRRVAVHDRGVDLAFGRSEDERQAARVSYRLGDITVPALTEKEALSSMVGEFADAIRSGRPARTDGAAGLRVLSVLEAVSESLAARGKPVAPHQYTNALAFRSAS
ncbi:Gfo/Idh/MocA family protein [Nocardia sp. 348MFTsu5.1]|uniref:Gfo/Idh/MocA family protein n=1 Tax=Nocardia sp. 348MFTsu5.1 TaxID=1172185 RepID=UPI0003657272|nr:Gfo/Idh/MocA family oxidoreductase [Nocardia sp. 348MFTsu5.1]